MGGRIQIGGWEHGHSHMSESQTFENSLWCLYRVKVLGILNLILVLGILNLILVQGILNLILALGILNCARHTTS
jgi:hypothetical protein